MRFTDEAADVRARAALVVARRAAFGVAASGLAYGTARIVVDDLGASTSYLWRLRPASALVAVLAGLGLWLLLRGGERARQMATACAAVVAAVGAGLCEQASAGRSAGLDDLGLSGVSPPGAPPLALGVDWLLLGLALYARSRRGAGPAWLVQGPACVVGWHASLSLFGLLYGIPSIVGIVRHAQLGLPSSLLLFGTCVALLASQPERGLARVLVSDDLGGVFARRLMPAVAVVTVAFGGLRLLAERSGLLSLEFGVALFTAAALTAGLALIWWSAIALQREDRARRAALIAAQTSEENLSTTLDSIAEAVIATDVEGRIVRMNPPAEAMTGWTLAEAGGRPVSEIGRIVDATTGEPIAIPTARALVDGTAVALAGDLFLVSRTGDRRHVADSASPIRRAGGDVRGVVLVFRDTTTEVTARQHLARSEERYRQIVETAAEGVWIIDESGRTEFANGRLARLLGTTPDAMHDTELRRWTPDAARLLAPLNARLDRDDPGIEVRLLRTDGAEVLVHAVRSRWSGLGTRPGLLVMVLDVTASRQAEQRLRTTEDMLRQAQKMEAIGRLAGGVAHDFNNLLSVMIGFAQIAQADTPDSDPRHEPLGEIIAAGQRAADLTRQLLAFSRKQVLQPEVVDLGEVLRGTEGMVRRLIGEDIAVDLDLGERLWPVLVDRGQIAQVVLNLCVNARDAMPRGGTLMLATRNVALDTATATAIGLQPGRHVELRVRDSGVGMDAATRARIFEPFFSTKAPGRGTGLGLATVHGIVRQSDGAITVESAPGHGATFRILLPATSLAAPEPETLRVLPTGNETLLVVEDEPAVLAAARALLERCGYRVLVADGVLNAEALFTERGEAVQLLLTDVVLADGSGRDLARRLRQVRPDLRVLYMSGYPGAGEAQAMLDPGVAYLVKPLTLESLARKVRRVLDTPAGSV